MKQLLVVSCAVISAVSCERVSEPELDCDVTGDWGGTVSWAPPSLFIQARDHDDLELATTKQGMAVYPTSYFKGRRLDARHLLLGTRQCELSDDCKVIRCPAEDPSGLTASRHCSGVAGDWRVSDDRDADLRSAHISVLGGDALQIDLVGEKTQRRKGRQLDAFHLEMYFPKGTWTCVLANCGELACTAPKGHVELHR